jgi:hypothetical protein
MGLCGRLLIALLAVLVAAVPGMQLTSAMSTTVTHQMSAKSIAGSRIPAVIDDETARPHLSGASERLALLDAPLSLPDFATELFVPPRA